MIRQEEPKSNVYPNIRVGEIDTSAPFQSVRDAVSLFGEGAFSGDKRAIKMVKSLSAEEHAYVRDTQLHVAEKELKKLKEGLVNAENTKVEAFSELEKAMQKAESLSQKLKTVNEAKRVLFKATEIQAKRIEEACNGDLRLSNADLQQDLISVREKYMNALEELSVAKQELTKTRQDYDACLEVKNRAVKQFEEAENAVKVNKERAGELSKEISDVKETIEQVNQAAEKAKEELTKVFEEKDVQRQTFKAELEESAKELQAVKTEFDPELIKLLQTQLSERMSEICSLQKEMDDAKALVLDNQRGINLEMDSAKELLQKVLEEECVLHKLVDSLKFELENLRKEHEELKKKEAETESEADNLNAKLRKRKSELQICLIGEAKARGPLVEMIKTLNQVSAEKENAQQEVEKLKLEDEELEKEAEAIKAPLQEIEKLLKTALEEADQAKAAEEIALEKFKIILERTKTARSSTSELSTKITLSRDEFESLNNKVEESEKLRLLKVAAAMAQVEAVKASESEALMKLEATQKEIEDVNNSTEVVVKKANMAEAAKKAVEEELKRWGEIIDAIQLVSANNSSNHRKIQKQKSELSNENKNLDKCRSSLSNKATKSSFSDVFHKKNSRIDAGSPSHLPQQTPTR